MIQINSPNPNGDADVYVKGFPMRVKEDGSREIYPASPIDFCITDLFTKSAFDETQLATIETALTGATLPQLLGAAQYLLLKALDAKMKEPAPVVVAPPSPEF